MKKLKKQYRLTSTVTYGKYRWYVYPRLRSGTHKHFSTRQEKSYYFLHRIEYRGYPLKLRAARGKVLADPWDDLPLLIMSLEKSWKFNSRRKHQYYR